MISYAQNFEDVMIARLFDAGYRGFYVDIGAAHPEFLSVTRHFYDQGWSGINVEPSLRFHPLLCAARPNDINLQCAIGRADLAFRLRHGYRLGFSKSERLGYVSR